MLKITITFTIWFNNGKESFVGIPFFLVSPLFFEVTIWWIGLPSSKGNG